MAHKDSTSEHYLRATEQGLNPAKMFEQDEDNPYAICTASLEKAFGKDRSEFTDEEKQKYDDCVRDVADDLGVDV